MKRNIPKSQHTIPCMHLKHFAGQNPKGRVWSYDSIDGNKWAALPENTCVQTHFYSAELDSGEMDVRLEDHLSAVEGKAAPVYEKLLRHQIPGQTQARMDFANFLALMYTRTTAMRRMAGEIHGQSAQLNNFARATNTPAFNSAVKKYEIQQGTKISEAQKERVRQAMLDPTGFKVEVSKESTFPVIGVADKLTPIFYNMKWVLTLAENGFFITSDNPLVRSVDLRTCNPVNGDGGFRNKTAEISFPLSPKVMLLLSWKDSREIGMLERDDVLNLNKLRAAHSDRYLFSHIKDKRIIKLAKAFKDSRPKFEMAGFEPMKFAPVMVARRSN